MPEGHLRAEVRQVLARGRGQIRPRGKSRIDFNHRQVLERGAVVDGHHLDLEGPAPTKSPDDGFGETTPLAFETTPAYVLSLLYLAVFGSSIAFAGFLTLIKRIGAARAAYIGVMVPIVALVISAAFEGFRWHALTWIGIAVSVAGNIIILRGK